MEKKLTKAQELKNKMTPAELDTLKNLKIRSGSELKNKFNGIKLPDPIVFEGTVVGATLIKGTQEWFYTVAVETSEGESTKISLKSKCVFTKGTMVLVEGYLWEAENVYVCKKTGETVIGTQIHCRPRSFTSLSGQ